MTRKCTILAVVLILFATPVSSGGIPVPPTVVYIGPEAQCDYPTIQEALDDIFSCAPFCAPTLGGLQLRLSNTYQHNGNFEINHSLAIIGGFSSCGAASSGTQKLLQSTSPGALIVFSGPQSDPIRVTLGSLILIGSSSQSTIGGVLELQGGAHLELQNTRVSSGRAQQGGGMGMHGNNNRFTMTFDSTISGNIAFQEGGGIYCQDNGVIDFQEGSILSNSATIRGGGIAIFDCRLDGSALNRTRRIAANSVTRDTGDPSQIGFGGGIFASGENAVVELGGILSRTRIENNEVARVVPVKLNVSTSGGGLSAEEGAKVILRNVEFIGNEAQDGGGLSLQTGALVDIDRTSGPCLAGRASDCSAFIGNVATGRRVDVPIGFDLCNNGSGAAISGARGSIRRTTFRENQSISHDGCGLNQHPRFGSLITSAGSTTLEQNLAFNNLIQNNDDNFYFRFFFQGGQVNLHQNTVAFNNDAEALLWLETNTAFEAVGNILWNPDVGNMSSQNEPVDLSACNVLDKSLPADVAVGNTDEDPEFVDFNTANFQLAPGSPAINNCNDVNGRLSVGFDIEGRARPSSDGASNQFGDFDAGAFEFHTQPPDEVDLVIDLVETSDPDESGATFEARLTNVGLTTAAFGNFNIRFVKPAGGYTEVGGNWSCAEENVGGTVEVECSTFIASGLATSITTVPLIVEVNPDPADGTCTMNMRADSVSQPDTVSDNDAHSITIVDCAAAGIFDDRFEEAQP